MKTYDLPNYRMIKVSFVSPTNSRGSRIKIYESARYNDDKTQTKVFSYDYAVGDVCQQAVDILVKNGFNPVCRASENDCYVILCDNWAENFKNIKDLK